jgi:hypothetical protein
MNWFRIAFFLHILLFTVTAIHGADFDQAAVATNRFGAAFDEPQGSANFDRIAPRKPTIIFTFQKFFTRLSSLSTKRERKQPPRRRWR